MDGVIRVLHVTIGMNRNGVEAVIMNMYRGIDRTKIQFDFAIHMEELCSYEAEIEACGGRIFRLPKYTGKNHFEYVKAWHGLFKNNPGYQIIHGHVRSTAAIYLFIAKQFGLITIAHSHSTSSGQGLHAFVKNTMQLPIRWIADYLIGCSLESGEWLFGKRACSKDNFFVFKNAVDYERFWFHEEKRQQCRAELSIGDVFVVGHIGRLQPVKNHEFLLKVFKFIQEELTNSKLLIIGDGDLNEHIQTRIIDLGLNENVSMLGDREDIPALLMAMDAFVFPSLWEGIPLTLIEAQVSGVPCFVSDVITQDVIITSRVEKIPLKKGPKEWARIIIDRSKKQSDGRAVFVENEEYNIVKMVDAITRFYITAVAKQK